MSPFFPPEFKLFPLTKIRATPHLDPHLTNNNTNMRPPNNKREGKRKTGKVQCINSLPTPSLTRSLRLLMKTLEVCFLISSSLRPGLSIWRFFLLFYRRICSNDNGKKNLSNCACHERKPNRKKVTIKMGLRLRILTATDHRQQASYPLHHRWRQSPTCYVDGVVP